MVFEARARKASGLTTPRGIADVSVSENNVLSLLFIKSFCHLKT